MYEALVSCYEFTAFDFIITLEKLKLKLSATLNFSQFITSS